MHKKGHIVPTLLLSVVYWEKDAGFPIVQYGGAVVPPSAPPPAMTFGAGGGFGNCRPEGGGDKIFMGAP